MSAAALAHVLFPGSVKAAVDAAVATERLVSEALAARNADLISQLDALGTEHDALHRENLALKAPVARPTMTPEQVEQAKDAKCVHCGGVHAIACPRVKSMRFRGDGSVFAVEFWPDNEWPKNRVIFLEDYADADAGVPEPAQGA